MRILVALCLFIASMFPALATDCSGTTGASAATIFNTSSTRGFIVMNNSVHLLCLAFDGAATLGGVNCGAGSYPLNPGAAATSGGSFATPQGYAPSAPSIISATGAGDIYSCTRW